jgi:polyisoprenyl-teichoic acid--peptidoglycan teichoic acid transferase
MPLTQTAPKGNIMDGEHSVDFLKKKYGLAPKKRKKKKRRVYKKALGLFIVVVAVGALAFSYNIAKMTLAEPGGEGGGFSLFGSFTKLIVSDDKALEGEKDGRINILVLGNGGAGHAGPELTDTIIFGSFEPTTGEVGMLSIPRDTIVEIPDYGFAKVNHVNAYAEMEEKGSGPAAAADVLSGVLDQEIHYTVKIDFNAFESFIDAIGGVDVYVDRAFSDYTYPTEDDLTQTIHFEEGWMHMDSDLALKYSRSRHGTNGEGSDFARAARQQKVILAVKEKTLSPATLLNPGKLNKIIETIQENVETNLTFWEMVKLARFAPSISTENVKNTVLDTSYESPLYGTNINGAYVILPKKDDWTDVQLLASNLVNGERDEEEQHNAPPIVPAKVEIQNGTTITGLAYQTSLLLDGTGYDVTEIGNADSKSYEKTVIFDLTKGEKSDELTRLKEFLEADVSLEGWIYSDSVIPKELNLEPESEQESASNIDFLVILGDNAADLVLR